MKILNITLLLTILQVSNLLGAEEIDFETRKYKVVHSSGSFGTFGSMYQGDILEFNPQKLMTSKPRGLRFKEREEVKSGQAYIRLSEGDFQLTATFKNKHAKFTCYSFVSKCNRSKTRFDVIYDQSLVITFEVKGVIDSVAVLTIVKD